MFKQELQAFERDAFEQYINAIIQSPTNAQEQLQAIEKLVPGSDIHDFLYLLTQQKLTKGKLSESDAKMLKEEHRRGWRELIARQAFLDFDNSYTDKQRLDELNKIIKDIIHFQNEVVSKPYHQEHQGSSNIGEEAKDIETQNKKEATLDESIFVKDFVEDAKQRLKKIDKKDQDYQYIQESVSILSSMPLYLAHTIDFAIFHEEGVMQFAEQVAQQNQVAGIVNASFLAQIKAAMLKRKKQNEYADSLSNTLCEKMSLEQLQQLRGSTQGYTDQNIIGHIFTKEYREELSSENQQIWSNQEKYDNLLKLYNETKASGLPKSLQRSFLKELLILGPRVKSYNREHFKIMLKTTEDHYGGGTVAQKIGSAIMQKITESHANADWSQFIQTVQGEGSSHGQYIDHSLATQYLTYFACQNQGDLAEWKNKNNRFVTVDMVERIEDLVRVYQSTTGLKGLKLNKPMSSEEFQRINDEVSLKFLPENKDKFRIEEAVELHLEIKNIQTLHCKVFEFNTLTYYRKTLKPFNTSIDLDGLESSIVRKFEFNAPQNCKRTEKFEFPELTGKIGLFIIEFVGNGRSARAVIKKGSLSLIHKSTIAGHVATIIDDNREVCKGPKTGLWLSNKFYPAKEDGSIFINYALTQVSTNIIMVHNNFAQLGEFTQKQETYEFKCQFYLNEESVLVGSSATILITPELKINGRKASLSLLQNIVAKVETSDFIDQTPTTKTFTNLKVASDSDLEITFQVPPNLSFIKITLECKVLNTTTKQMNSFAQSKTFTIDTFQDSNEIHDFYLKLGSFNKYELHVLGKNGEPQPYMRQSITFQHAFNGEISTTLKTDEKGKIYLGTLDKVLTVKVNQRQSWLLPNLKVDRWSYPPEMDTVVGSKFEIPIAQMWDSAKPETLDRRQVTLTRSMNNVVLEDWFKKIKVVKKQNAQSHYFLLTVENLEAGQYNLFIRGEIEQQIKINVHKGQFLNNIDNMILKKNSLQELVTSQKIVKVKESSVVGSELKIQLADFTKNTRVHVMATHYVPNNSFNLLQSIQAIQGNQIGSSVFTFAKWTNLLLSDRLMSDEYRYVFDRVHAERSLGNSLDRPGIVNKRIFTRKTEIEQEVLQQGTAFQQQAEQISHGQERFRTLTQNYQPMMQNIMRESKDYMKCESLESNGRRNYRNSHYGYSSSSQFKPNLDVRSVITDYQNFLRDAPIVKYNLKPSEEGLVVFKHDKLSAYSTVQIVVVDECSAMQSTKNLQQLNDPFKRDLSLKKSLNESKGLTQSRVHKCLEKGQSEFVEDITSSEIMLVDDLQKVNKILSQIKKLSGIAEDDFVKLDFVRQWQSLSTDKKNYYFGEYFCHELNFFIKKHDNPYFESTVRHYLQSKMEKSFVDQYLLDQDHLILKKYTSPKLGELNAFEKCLFIEVLVRNGQSDFGARILAQMRDQVEGTDCNNGQSEEKTKFQNKVFDLVLNMDSMSKNQSSIDQGFLQMTQVRQANAQIQRSAQLAPSVQNFRSVQKAISEDDDEDCMQECEEEQASYGSIQNYNDDCDFGEMEMEQYQRNASRADLYMNNRLNHFAAEKFEQLEATNEYMDTFYYNTKLKGGHDTTYLVQNSRFWCDYAHYLISKGTTFVSSNFTDCVSSIEQFLCLVVLGLNETTQASVHKFQADDSRGVTIVAGSSLIVFKKEIKEVEVDLKHDYMVTHRYSRIDDYGIRNKTDDDDAVPSEFLVNVPYECEVILTNVSPLSAEFNLLYQIPIGSMPIKKTKFMKSQPIRLESYSTQRLTFQFYFPQTGKFCHYPSNVSVGEKVTARGQFNTLNVVSRRKICQDDAAELNFDDLVQVGSNQQILDYLKTKNILSTDKGFSFDKIMYLFQNKDFWTQAIAILRERQIYVKKVWKLSCLHLDIPTIKEYIDCENLVSQIQGEFTSSLCCKDNQFKKMLEYNPMINSRAHKVGQESCGKTIANKTFRQTYDKFLQAMAYKQSLSFTDKMTYVYYLQLQDRIPEAIKLFQTLELPEAHNIESSDVSPLEIQYDYLNAYFDFFTGFEDKFKIARRIVQRYDNYPVSNWKMLFLAIEDQLNDFDGEFDLMTQNDYDSEYTGSEASLKLKKQENMKKSKNTEPVLSQTQIDDQGTLTLESVNIKSVLVKYYMIDAEILFSRAPFLKDNAEEFSYVKPCLQKLIDMRPADATQEELAQYITSKVELPESLKNKNLVIEINGEGQQQFKTFYSSELKVQINEQFGELKVMHQNKMLGQVYIKVFMMAQNGKESFYRDGYTDIRGKFEFAVSSGNNKLKQVKKFSILIHSEQYGSQIKEVNPPQEQAAVEPLNNTLTVAEENQYQYLQPNIGSLSQQKQARMCNRNNWVQSKKK